VSQCLNQTLQQLFARVIEILGQLWILLEHFDHDGWQVLVQCHLCARILRKAVIALDDVLQKPSRRFLKLAVDHIVEHCADGKEPLRSVAQVFEALIVHQDLLDNKSRHSLR
jgi:hypothetical protein